MIALPAQAAVAKVNNNTSAPLSTVASAAEPRKLAETKSQFVPILPKSVSRPPVFEIPQIDRSKRQVVPLPLRKRCNIPVCRTPNCPLRTHHQYRYFASSRKPKQHASNSQESTAEEMPPLIIGTLSAFPKMPLASLDNDIFRGLLHDFFVMLWDRIFVLLHPPPLLKSAKLRIQQGKEAAFGVAMSNSVYCLNFIAAMYQYSAIRRGSWRPNSTTAMINGQLIRLLREKLADFKPSEVEQLINVVFTLVTYDVGQGKLNHLGFHRNAMQSLVASCGGLHNTGSVIQTVLTLDRIISIFTGSKPVYAVSLDTVVDIQRAARYPTIYGHFFMDDLKRKNLDPDVVAYCEGACRAIEILEGENWTFDPTELRDSSELHYFYFFRDQIIDQFPRLNARHHNTFSKTRCILLATKIVDYRTLMDDYLPPISFFLADRLQEAICQQDIGQVWADWDDTFIWTLFVLLSTSKQWAGHGWALRMVKDQLDIRYGGASWPVDWCQREMSNVQSFVWSNTRFGPGFNECCAELEVLSQAFQS